MSVCGDLKVWVSFLCSRFFLHGGGSAVVGDCLWSVLCTPFTGIVGLTNGRLLCCDGWMYFISVPDNMQLKLRRIFSLVLSFCSKYIYIYIGI